LPTKKIILDQLTRRSFASG